MSVKYPVYRLVINCNDIDIETGIRIFDARSLYAATCLYRSGAFGRLGRNRFTLVLDKGEAEDIPRSFLAFGEEEQELCRQYKKWAELLKALSHLRSVGNGAGNTAQTSVE